MEIVNFYPITFNEIQEQDNPAFGDDACLMIVRESFITDHAVVLQIVPDPIESVAHIAKFWRVEGAIDYCDYLISK